MFPPQEGAEIQAFLDRAGYCKPGTSASYRVRDVGLCNPAGQTLSDDILGVVGYTLNPKPRTLARGVMRPLQHFGGV